MSMDHPHLRGGSVAMVHSLLRRVLQDETLSNETTSTPAPVVVETAEKETSAMYISIIVGLVFLFYLLCTFQCLKMIFCRRCMGDTLVVGARNQATEGTVLVHEGRVFNLNGELRRAVLEAIFSETSKPASDKEVTPKRKRRRRRNDETVPDNVEIPGIATAETDVTNETHESYQERRSFHDDHHQDDDDDAFSDASSEDEIIRAIDPSEAEDEDVLSPTASSMHTDESLIATPTVRNLVRTPSFDSEDLTPKTTPSLSAAQTLPVLPTGANEEGDDDYHAGDFSEILRPKLRSPNTRFVPAQRLTPPSTDELSLSLPSLNVKRERHTNFPIPEDQVVVEGDEGIEGEESKEEIEPVGGSAVAGAGGVSVEVLSQDDHVGPPLHIPIPLVARDSLMTVTSDYTYDDESTCSSSIVCPICLSGYRMGDFIVTSKYCTHMFHKQCILEWLTKHDDCPICRVKMVTASEISKAAIHMVRAGAPIPASATTAATTTSMIEMTTPTLPSVQTPPMSPPSRRVNSPFGGLGLAVLLATSAEGDQQYPSR